MYRKDGIRSRTWWLCFTLLAALCSSPAARADHYSGGSITYECLGGNFYRISLHTYVNCDGAAVIPQTINFSNNCGVNFTLTNQVNVFNEEVSPVCDAQLPNTTCNGGTLPGFRYYRYEVELFLSPCNAWNISWSLCCRNASNNLTFVTGMYVNATLNNTGGLCDTSPQLTQDDGIPYFCVGQPASYNLGASDPNGHTMVFSLVDALYAAPNPTVVWYNPGFTGAEPIPGITIDPATGQIEFTPTVIGYYVVVVQVNTYTANGTLIGYIKRDMMFAVVPCPGLVPVPQGLSNNTGGVILAPNQFEVCDGQAFCVDYTFIDPDAGGVLQVVSNAVAQLPGATFTVNGSNPAVATICWLPDATILPVNVFLEGTDNDCPIANQASTAVLITAAQVPPVPPNPGLGAVVPSCTGTAVIDLFAQLGGTPDAGGNWTGPDGQPHAPLFDPDSDLPGDYIYAVGNACVTNTATISVVLNTLPDPGVDGAVTVCDDAAPIDLLGQLGGTPEAGGQWSGPMGLMGGTFDPSTDPAGLYTYLVTGATPCPDASSALVIALVAAPDAGQPASLTLCGDAAPVDLFALLGGADAGGAWTGPSGAASGIFDPTAHLPGVYTYTVNGTAPCANASATVTITVNQPVDAGLNASITLCDDGAAVDLFAQLGGSPDVGGAWVGPSGASNGVFDPALATPGIYTYTVSGTAPCASASAAVTVSVNTAVDAGSDGAITLCDDGAAVDLFAQLGGSPDVGGAWVGPSGASNGVFDPALATPGIYTYTVSGTAPCASASAAVTVSVNTAVDAGSDGAITLCDDGAAVDLFAQLGGSPDVGGAWVGPSGASNGVFDPALATPGIYTYTVSGTAPCASASAAVTVSVNTAVDAGSDGAITLCDDGAAVDLFAQLGGSPDVGGAWVGPSGASNGVFDPALATPGIYTYTVSGTAPCASASAAVTVSVNTAVDAGSDGAITLCDDGAAVDLFAQLGGSPDAGGAWVGPSGASNGVFDPALATPGIYTYTVSGTAPCANASAAVTVSVNTAVDAGSDGAITLCDDGAAVDLFAQLGGSPDAGGAWVGPSGASNGVFDPALATPGIYTYTVSGTAPCANASAAVTVSVNTAVDAGSDGAITLCDDGAAVDLFAQLGGSPDAGGAWVGPSGASNGVFDPALATPGIYTYTVSGTAPCANASAAVTVSVNTAVDAGSDGAITLCDDGAAVDLFAQLGGSPDAGGAWVGPSGASNGVFDPTNATPGTYTYTMSGTAPCADASAVVTVIVNGAADAGSDGAITLCESDIAVELFNSLGGSPDAGGSWTGPAGPVSSLFDPAAEMPGLYVYTVVGNSPCLDASAAVTVEVNTAADAGSDVTLSICSSDPVVDLFGVLGGTPMAGGSWSGPSGPFAGVFDPAVDPPGDYTYSVDALPPCPASSASATVTISFIVDAGQSTNVTLCELGAAVDLFTQLGGAPDAGGSWNGPNGAMGGVFDPAADPAGDYVYTVSGVAPCADASATLTIALSTAADAGLDGSGTLCGNDAAVDLFTLLGGTPDANGSWSGPGGAMNGSFDPATSLPGTYTYTVAAPAPCPGASATVTMSVQTPPVAGNAASATLCELGAAVDLFTQLGGTPDAGGSWNGPNGAMGGVFDPAADPAGDYVYTVSGVAPCADASATLTIALSTAADAGLDGSGTLCGNDAAVDLFMLLGGTPDANGSWSGPGGAMNGSFDPATSLPGTYTYTVAAPAPCPGASATVTMSVQTPPVAGNAASATLCELGAAVDLFTQLGGTPDAGGSWNGPDGAMGGVFDPAADPAGDYVYTVSGVAPCADASATLTIALSTAADAGLDGSGTLCGNDAAVDLFTLLGGTPDANGSWSGPGGAMNGSFDPATSLPGSYTYTVAAPAPCPGASATVTMAVEAPPVAGNAASATLCELGAAVDLFPQLGGAPDAGGSWSGPNGAMGGVFDPAADPAGDYVYTVNGVAPCADASATLTIALSTAADAGLDGSGTLCGNDAAVDLFMLLGGTPDANGSWSGPGGAMNGSFDPATSLPGTYTYTVAAPAPCPGASATVTMSVQTPPVAGNAASATLCELGAAVDLFTQLGGTPDAGGSWNGPDGAMGGVFDPAADPAGDYVYTVSGVAPCADASATLTIALSTAADAGLDGSGTLCGNDAAVDLFTLLGGTPDANGSWSGPGGAMNGSFDPATSLPGSYTYTVAAPAPCPGASATVTMAVETPPTAGLSASVHLCETSASFAPFNALGGAPQPGGSWIAPDGSPFLGDFIPGSSAPGTYTYIVAGIVCASAQAELLIDVDDAPDAGGDTVVTFCSSDGVITLFGLLGGTPDANGSWTDPNGNNATPSFTPGSSPAGIYTYTVSGGGVCPDAQATVLVGVAQAPLAGTDGALQVCSDASTISLFEGLGGTLDAGGTWTGPDGLPHNTVFDPLLDPPGVYTYTVSTSPACPPASAVVQVSVVPAPYAGEDAAILLCTTDAVVDLGSLLGGNAQQGGVWAGPGGVAASGVFDPGSGAQGLYTYTVQSEPGCGSDQATITVQVTQAANAGTGTTAQLCTNDGPLDLFAQLGGGPDAGGAWTGPAGQPFSGIFDPAINAQGNYVYTVQAPAPCPAVTAVVTVAVIQAPVAEVMMSGDGTCVPATVTFTQGYNGPGTCTWWLGNGQVVQDCGPITVVYDTPGSYDITLSITADNGCGADAITIPGLVQVADQPVASFSMLPEVLSTSASEAWFQNQSTGASWYQWSFGALGGSNLPEPSFTFPDHLGGDYTVCLVAFASAACADTLCKVISVEDGLGVFVPNAFTPDSDGFNDLFGAVVPGADPAHFHFEIFDRWGRLMYETRDPQGRWDGRWSDGTETPIGTYVWRLAARDLFTGRSVTRTGHVTLLR
ncbi:MAG: gliding motility-associated C-terminal domain-containing protein [Flavobacteriales bacterium]|nr:gliding motility-associated C-terminal domain-containing protein [Flavobacteriales bacterium]